MATPPTPIPALLIFLTLHSFFSVAFILFYISMSTYYYYCFLAVLGLRCCMWALPSCGERGPLSSCDMWASHCSGFSCGREQALGKAGFSSCGIWAYCLVACGTSWTRDLTRVPCIGRWILNHCTDREAPACLLIILIFCFCFLLKC